MNITSRKAVLIHAVNEAQKVQGNILATASIFERLNKGGGEEFLNAYFEDMKAIWRQHKDKVEESIFSGEREERE